MIVNFFPTQLLAPVRYRGCELCNHGGQGARTCRNPAFQSEPSRAAKDLREPGSACGPEAKGLAFPGLEG